MSELTLEALGITKDDLTTRLVNTLAAHLLSRHVTDVDEDGEEFSDSFPTEWKAQLDKMVMAKINESIEAIAAKNILPNVQSYIESITLQATNEWGEKTGKKPLTFIEYLTQRAEKYITEEVDHNGRSQEECRQRRDSFYGKSQTRIAHLIHEHLQYSISVALKSALEDLNSKIAQGLAETVKIKLAEAMTALKASVKIG